MGTGLFPETVGARPIGVARKGIWFAVFIEGLLKWEEPIYQAVGTDASVTHAIDTSDDLPWSEVNFLADVVETAEEFGSEGLERHCVVELWCVDVFWHS